MIYGKQKKTCCKSIELANSGNSRYDAGKLVCHGRSYDRIVNRFHRSIDKNMSVLRS